MSFLLKDNEDVIGVCYFCSVELISIIHHDIFPQPQVPPDLT